MADDKIIFWTADEKVLAEMRSRARAGQRASEILRWLERDLKSGLSDQMFLMREAFCFKLDEVFCLGGWKHDGTGELSHARIDSMLMPLMLSRRPLWDRDPPPERDEGSG